MSSTMAGLRALFLITFLVLLSASLFAATETPQAPVLTAPHVNDDYLDQGLFEDALPKAQSPKAKPGEWFITVNADITVNYTFKGAAKDNFKLVYHITASSPVKSFPTVARGNATIKTEITGYLAKWTTGQCLLQVDVAAVPYEMAISKEGEDKMKLALQFKQKILEDWQSLCTFVDAPDSHFYTRGEPEKWIADALQKADPSLDKLLAPMAPKNKTETKFSISKYTVSDGHIGSADVDGGGSVIVEPPAELPDEKK